MGVEVREYVAQNSSPMTKTPSGMANNLLAAGTEKSLITSPLDTLDAAPASGGGERISIGFVTSVNVLEGRSRVFAIRFIV